MSTSTNFDVITCTQLIINPTTTSLKWDPSKSSPNITILGSSDTIRTGRIYDLRNVLSYNSFVVGTNGVVFTYTINEASDMFVGLALIDYTPVLSQYIQAIDGDIVKISLNTNETGSVHLLREGKESSFTYDVKSFSGQTVYAWLSIPPLFSTSVKIALFSQFSMSVGNTGTVTTTSGGTPATIVSTDTIKNDANTASVTVGSDGNTLISSGITHRYSNISTGIASVSITNDQYLVRISNALITTVILPSIASSGKEFIIFRDYPLQFGETWQNPVLVLVPSLGNTINNLSSQGMPYKSVVHIISENSNWKNI